MHVHVQVCEEIALQLCVLHTLLLLPSAATQVLLNLTGFHFLPMLGMATGSAISNPEITGVDRVTPFISGFRVPNYSLLLFCFYS